MPPGAGNLSLMASVSSRTTSNTLKRRLSAASQIQSSSNRKKRLNNKRSEAFTTMATLVSANTTTSPPPDDSSLELSKLKTWIQQQETNPTPLTTAQRKHLTDLISSLKVEEPTLGDKDWVSLLQRFRDAHQLLYKGAIFYEDAPANNNKKFTCTVTLNLTNVSPGLDFPNQDIGYVDSSLPAFGRKKDAKRYAAKCCVEWLMRDHYMPSDGQNVSFSPNSKEAARVNDHLALILKGLASPPSTAPKPSGSNHAMLLAQTQGPSASQLSLNGGAPLEDDSDVQIMQKSDVAGDDGNKEPNIATSKKVIELCNHLGFCAPQYILTPMDEGRDLYDGRVSFGPDDCKVPDNLGRVRAVYSKRFAKEAVAEQVLVWLQTLKKQRMADLEEVIDNLP